MKHFDLRCFCVDCDDSVVAHRRESMHSTGSLKNSSFWDKLPTCPARLLALLSIGLAAFVAGCVALAQPTAVPTLPTHNPTPTVTPTLPTHTPTPTLTPAPTATPTHTPTINPTLVPLEINRGNPAVAKVALTFDAMPGTPTIPRIVAALRAAGVRATFFLTGDWAGKSPDLLKQIVADGHEIGNHSWSHPDMTKLTDKEIEEQVTKEEANVESVVGDVMKPYFRTPFGTHDPRVKMVIGAMGYRLVYWSLDSGDWLPERTAEQELSRVIEKAQNGFIIVMHGSSSQTAESLPQVIEQLRTKGFQLVTLSELLETTAP
jgi:peptidoglycan/xylan/chitin deacetylase (PgdA/CDA1 family)